MESEKINKKILQFFATLSDETRLKILVYLSEKPRKVNEIHEHFGKEKITLSAISHQLKQLSDLEIVKYDKKGREKIYTLSSNFCWCILNDAFKHFEKRDEGIGCERCSQMKH